MPHDFRKFDKNAILLDYKLIASVAGWRNWQTPQWLLRMATSWEFKPLPRYIDW